MAPTWDVPVLLLLISTAVATTLRMNQEEVGSVQNVA